VDRRADAFEIYLARNIFKVPETKPMGKEVGREGGREGRGSEEDTVRSSFHEKVLFTSAGRSVITFPSLPPPLPRPCPVVRMPWMWLTSRSGRRRRRRRKT